MKFFFFLILFISLINCSFDNKTGIWKNENSTINTKNDIFKEFSEIILSEEDFNKKVELQKNFSFKLKKPTENSEWLDIYYNKNNNLNNFKFNKKFDLIYKSKKLSRHKISQNILFNKGLIITSDIKGNLIIFSLDKNQILTKFNFYKRKYKKIDKYLNLIIQNDIVYISDNIGFLYSYDLKENRILWAKKNKVPFRSNLKLIGNILITSNQNNELLFYAKSDGNLLKSFPTEETKVKNQFKNNLAINGNKIFFINTFGSLYSVDIENKNLNWFINLNQTNNVNPSNLFLGNEIIVENKKIISTSNKFTYIIDSITGSIIYKKKISSIIKPLAHNNFFLLINKNNFLIAIDSISGNILYSYDLDKKVSEFFKIKKKNLKIKNIMMLNNEIFVFLKNSYVLILDINGSLKEIRKFPSSIYSQPILVDNKILYLDKNSKIFIVN